jgi:hypothetical protein
MPCGVRIAAMQQYWMVKSLGKGNIQKGFNKNGAGTRPASCAGE